MTIGSHDPEKLIALKEQIISQARPVFGPHHPTGHTFDILFTRQFPKLRYGTALDHKSIATLVVYTRPGSFAEFKALAQGIYAGSQDAFKKALEELMARIQMMLEREYSALEVGKTYGEAEVQPPAYPG